MVTESTLVGFAYLVTGTSLLFLLLEPLKQPENPGSKGFAVAITGVALWPIGLGLNYFVADLGLSITLWYVRMLGAALIGVGWFLLAVTVTTSEDLADRLEAPLAGYVLLTQVVVWTDPWHHLVVDPATTIDGTVLMVVDGPWFWVQAAVNYGLIVGATMLLANDFLETTGVRRKQAGLLALAPVPPAVANLVSIFDVTSTVHDLTPFGLIGSGVLLTYALYRVRFLEIAPIARDVAMGDMRDAVVTLDDDDRVVDCNDRAEAMFDPPREYVGVPAAEFFAAVPPATRERFTGVSDVDTEISTPLDGETRHFSLTISPVTEGGRQLGRVLVLHDITEIKEESASSRAARPS